MARLMPSWRSLPQTGTVSDCAGDTARFAITCSPSSTIPRWQPTTTEANGNCAPPQPIARSSAASVPTGAPTCSPPSAPLSELPHAEASTPIRPFARPYAGSPFSNRVEQIHWWSLFVRLADPDHRREAITSRPLLLQAIARQTRHAGQVTLTISSAHGEQRKARRAYVRIAGFFAQLRRTAEQMDPVQRWYRILSEALRRFLHGRQLIPPARLEPA